MSRKKLNPCPLCQRTPRMGHVQKTSGIGGKGPTRKVIVFCDGGDSTDHLIEITGHGKAHAAERWNQLSLGDSR